MAARGDQRREALAGAAAELIAQHGFAAVSHRAVAAHAGLPLASTTYYYSSLEDLRAAGLDRLADAHLASARAAVLRLPSGRVTARTLAARIAAVWFPGERDAESLRGFYERYVEAGRSTALQRRLARWNNEARELVAEAARRSGHDIHLDTALALLDGAVLTALAEGAPDPAEQGVDLLVRYLGESAS